MGEELLTGVINYTKGQKKWNKKLAILYPKVGDKAARIEIYDSKDEKHKSSKKNVISLEKCTKVKLEHAKEGKKGEQLELTFSDEKSHFLSSTSEDDLEAWTKAINLALSGKSTYPGPDMLNEVFFEVEIRETDVTAKFNLSGTYLLNVSSEDIELLSKETRQPMIKWPLQLLRKYGRDKQEFSLEAGRRCPSGEGMFYFITDKYNAIFQEVERNVKCLASRSRAQSTSSTGASKSYPSFKHPHSPESLAPPSPSVPSSSVYEDPFDAKKKSKAIDADPTYSEPISLQTPPKNTKSKGKKVNFMKKNKAPLEGPPKPARQMVAEAQYGETPGGPGADDDPSGTYSQLNIGNTDQNDYDSISYRDKWGANAAGSAASSEDPESTYATASNFPDSYKKEDDYVYDHVKR